MEYLIESILEPNKNVKEGFEAIAITTKTLSLIHISEPTRH